MSDSGGNQQATVATGFTPVADDEALAPGQVVGEFRIEQVLGRGGMGTVYGAVHTVIGKRGAVKVLREELCTDQDQVGRFVQEARAVNQIGHPNIVDVFAFGTLPDGRSYMVMEWLVGESLRTRLRRAPLPRDEIRDVLVEVIRALEAAHAQGIIHRDLKPDNVFLVEVAGERPRAKLLDFGVAKLTGEGRHDRTRLGSMLGTPQYIAPEQARGEATMESDIYALGVMLFELVAGHTPFTGDSVMEVVSKHMMDAPPRLSTVASGIPKTIDDLVDATLAKEPAHRPTLGAIRSALAALTPELPAVSQLGVRTVTVRPRRHLGLAIGLAVVVAAAVVTFVLVRRSRSDETDGAATARAPDTAVESRSVPPQKPPAPAPTRLPTPLPPAPASAPATDRNPASPAASPERTRTFTVVGWKLIREIKIDGKVWPPARHLTLPFGTHHLEIRTKRESYRDTIAVDDHTAKNIYIRPLPLVPSNKSKVDDGLREFD